MAKRKIIRIDQDKCNGCGQCIPNCPEGAIQIIDEKARLISDLFCDGLGACLGSCPLNAITIEEREARDYDEKQVMANIIKQGPNTIKAHLDHLKSHGANEYLEQALEFLKEKGMSLPEEKKVNHSEHKGCPGMKMMNFNGEENVDIIGAGSSLRQWPIQLQLISPLAPYYKGKDVILTADCVAYTLGDFHARFFKGKSIAIACPKLDSERQQGYIEKIQALVDDAEINTLTVIIMEVPCCRGLLVMAQEALKIAKRKIPLKCIVVSIKGEVLSQEWV